MAPASRSRVERARSSPSFSNRVFHSRNPDQPTQIFVFTYPLMFAEQKWLGDQLTIAKREPVCHCYGKLAGHGEHHVLAPGLYFFDKLHHLHQESASPFLWEMYGLHFLPTRLYFTTLLLSLAVDVKRTVAHHRSKPSGVSRTRVTGARRIIAGL
jgi:hypothetical protein